MSVSKSKAVVFHRSKSGFEASDPTGWNDLAIIKAYDAAVAPDLKMEDFEDDNPKVGDVVWKRTPGVEVKKSSDSTTQSKNAAKKARKRKRAALRKAQSENDSNPQWKVGDSCMAFYMEDQRYYQAVIKEIHHKQGTVVLSYVDYDEDEVVAIKDIFPEHLWTNAGINLDSNRHENSLKQTKKAKVTRQTRRFGPTSNSSDVELSYDAPLPFMPNMGDIGLSLPNLQNMTRDCSNIPKEALSSMLVSWYMAGYQTGYYRGLTASSRK